jgi:hypothetical protein
MSQTKGIVEKRRRNEVQAKESEVETNSKRSQTNGGAIGVCCPKSLSRNGLRSKCSAQRHHLAASPNASNGANREVGARKLSVDIRQQTFNQLFKEHNAALGIEPAKEMIRMYTV